SSLQQTLAANGQWLPIDPPGLDGTVGGLLAANRSGPARMRYGTARDLVIGLKIVMADGAVVRTGGRVVKNVAGYDMAKLHIGALGSLGVITEVSFKIAPLPRHQASLCFEGSLTGIMSTSLLLRNRGLAVQGLELFVQEG